MYYPACLAVYAHAGLALIGPVLSGRFFADDWELYLPHPAPHILRSFLEPSPYDLYRPLQLSLIALSNTLFGPTTLPVHLLNLVCHVLVALLVTRVLRGMGAGHAAAGLGGGYVIVSQLACSAVGGNDTISLTMSVLFGSVSLWWMSGLGRPPRPGVSCVAFALALLSKESALGYLPLLSALAWRTGRGLAVRPPWARLALIGAPTAITLLYLGWRSHVGASTPLFHADPRMQLGANIPRNLAQLGLAALVPVPTTWIYTGATLHRWLWPALGALSAVLLATFLAVGVRSGIGRGRAWVWGLAGLVSIAPTLPLRHVSELYAYSLVPVLGVLFGLAAGSVVERADRLARRLGACSLLVVVLGGNALSSRWDASAMNRNGEYSGRLLERILGRIRAMPHRSTLVLVDPKLDAPNYSEFQMKGFRGAALSPEQFFRLTGRRDVAVRNTSHFDPFPADLPGPAVFTVLEDGDMVPLYCLPARPR